MIESKIVLNNANEKIFVETYTPEHIKSTVVFCHGITGCRKGRTPEDSYFQDLATRLMGLGFKAVLFDFSGHGDSEGNDYDVCLSKSTDELERVFNQEVDNKNNVSFVVFSYGACVLGNFLTRHPDVVPNRIAMYSPCFMPLESCFLSKKSIFGKDIVADYESGALQSRGYALVGAKNFRFGMKMIDECKNYSSDCYKKLVDRILVLSGRNDVILDTEYNDKYCAENGIRQIYVVASHSLFEDIEKAFAETISFLNV